MGYKVKDNKDEIRDVIRYARMYSREGIDKLIEMMRDTSLKASVRLAAIEALLDRGLGKPAQSLDLAASIEQRHIHAMVNLPPAATREDWLRLYGQGQAIPAATDSQNVQSTQECEMHIDLPPDEDLS